MQGNQSRDTINFATYFRPLTFEDVVGQEVPKAVLKRIAQGKGVSVRAIFLKGPYGTGKTTLCRIFACAMNCEHFHTTGEVCLKCDGCKDVLSRNSQLYWELDSSMVGNVEYMRDLPEQLSYTPQGRRVVVLDESHACSKQSLNALLKIIENGVPNTVFVFASTEDILPTLKSRCVCLDLSPVPLDLVKQRVESVAERLALNLPQGVSERIALRAGGHLRDALSLLQLYHLTGEEALTSSYNLFEEFMLKCLRKDSTAHDLLPALLRYPVLDIKESIYLFLRNIYCATADSPLYALRRMGTGGKLLNYFFSPTAQGAMREEIGMEVLLRSFLDKIFHVGRAE